MYIVLGGEIMEKKEMIIDELQCISYVMQIIINSSTDETKVEDVKNELLKINTRIFDLIDDVKDTKKVIN